MSIPVNGGIGLEEHAETDQFIRLDRGRGPAQMGPAEDDLTFDQEVSDGWCVLVPAGSWHEEGAGSHPPGPPLKDGPGRGSVRGR
jgi:mannose-6-phosphate isomerase-like protein (cupin superfamily)